MHAVRTVLMLYLPYEWYFLPTAPKFYSPDQVLVDRHVMRVQVQVLGNKYCWVIAACLEHRRSRLYFINSPTEYIVP